MSADLVKHDPGTPGKARPALTKAEVAALRAQLARTRRTRRAAVIGFARGQSQKQDDALAAGRRARDPIRRATLHDRRERDGSLEQELTGHAGAVHAVA
jgi:hypothetical protein